MLADRIRTAAAEAAASGITIASSNTLAMGASATENVTLCGTPAENDVYVVALARDSTSAIGTAAISAGWSRIYNYGAETIPVSVVFLKRMTSSPDSTIPIEGDTSFSGSTAVAMIQVKGVDTSTAQDAALTSASGSSGMPNPPSHTTVTANALRIVTGHIDDDNTSGWSLSGWTVLTKGVGTGGRDATVALGYKLAATAGAENPSAFSGSADDEWAATHFSLRPAA